MDHHCCTIELVLNCFCITDSCTIEPVPNRFCITDSCTIEPVPNRFRRTDSCTIEPVPNLGVSNRYGARLFSCTIGPCPIGRAESTPCKIVPCLIDTVPIDRPNDLQISWSQFLRLFARASQDTAYHDKTIKPYHHPLTITQLT